MVGYTGSVMGEWSFTYDKDGNQVTEISGAGAWKHTNVYADGELLATYDPNGVHFAFGDWQGTKRAQASATGTLEVTCDNLPFNDGFACQGPGGSDATEHHYTGKEHDPYTGLDLFGARNFTNYSGRFMSPDPSGLYYADPNNPQSLNLYSYVLNNPLRNVDPDGLSCYWDDGTHDDDPSEGGASQSDCASQGGTWIDKPTTFVSVTANPNNDDVSTSTVTISTPLGYQQCQPAQFKVTGVGPGQAPGNGAFTGQPPANGQVAIKPQNFGVPYNTKAQRNSAQQLGVSSVVSNIVIFPNYGTNTAPLPKNTPQTPFGAPSGPLTPADVIGPASVRNSPGNQIDVYRYASQSAALSSTRMTTPTIFVPINSSGVGCPD